MKKNFSLDPNRLLFQLELGYLLNDYKQLRDKDIISIHTNLNQQEAFSKQIDFCSEAGLTGLRNLASKFESGIPNFFLEENQIPRSFLVLDLDKNLKTYSTLDLTKNPVRLSDYVSEYNPQCQAKLNENLQSHIQVKEIRNENILENPPPFAPFSNYLKQMNESSTVVSTNSINKRKVELDMPTSTVKFPKNSASSTPYIDHLLQSAETPEKGVILEK